MRRSKSAQQISKKLNAEVESYASVALAAGVTLLALAVPAKGEVVVTKKTISIPPSTEGLPVSIDLNHDGVKDVSFSLYSFAYHSFDQTLRITPLEGGAVVGAANSRDRSYASALMRGARVGASAHFSSKNSAVIERAHGFDASSKYSRHLYGNWGGNPVNRYLGVKFLIGGKTHFGWVRLTVTTEPRGLSATITAYAYETIANKKISVGIGGPTATTMQLQQFEQPRHSLGMLALGADGLSIWRRDTFHSN
jgi:hypothetical protein